MDLSSSTVVESLIEVDAIAPLSKTFPKVSRKMVIANVPSGEIRLEQGGDGLYLQFDCDCKDALPWCQAQCCGLMGIEVERNEAIKLEGLVEWDEGFEVPVMKRDADAFCTCLDRETRTCQIYSDRPSTCREFHCTRGASVRGWKLGNSVHLQARS
jgi:hypothetical protein